MNRHRLQFDVSDDMWQVLQDLLKRTSASTRAEVVRRALSCYKLFVDADDLGGRIQCNLPNGDVEKWKVLR